MRYYEREYARHTQNKPTGTFFKQFLLSVLLLILCVGIRFYPDDSIKNIKNAIWIIVSENTDVKAEYQKIKGLFIKDKSLDTLSPVSDLAPPSSKAVAKGFGMQDASGSNFHYGVDVFCGKNENIVASGDGKVSEIAKSEEYGSYIIISHSEEIKTLYGQLNEIIPNVGDSVKKGQAIARAGGENSTFYFELRRGDTYLDPTQFIKFSEE